ncbi:hypothetical protein JJJ17_14855 [Paracoccus caeni]|uniref:Uncharacterized protein n=1 Tax=Paracoccus caeni TaxID=657651 RepID=A0A934SGW4_9RHOB|nr:hypothetical protein [Paracoccus caeni]MBK4217209.1 hypothetical protein [Paracoccus caeni]
MTPRLALIALLTLPIAACEGINLPGQEEPQVEGHKGPPGVSPLEQAIETGAEEGRALSTAEATTYNTAAFSARGNEPFWAVDVAGNTAIYKTPENQRGTAIRVDRIAFAEGVEYIGVHRGRPFTVNIRAARCQDSMSGDRFPMTATVTVAGNVQRGCAGPASAEVAQAVAATRAPAPAEPRATRRATPAATRPAATPAPAAETPAAETPATTPAETPATDAPATPVQGTPASEMPPAPTTAPAAPAPDAPAPDAPAPAAPAATDAPAAPAAPVQLPSPSVILPATPPSLNSDGAGDQAEDAAD